MTVFARMMFLAVLFLAACMDEDQADRTDFSVVDGRMFMSGDINSQALVEFNQVIAAHPDVDTLVLMDMPGSLNDEAMQALGYRVRSLGLNTHLTDSSAIYSGAVDLFLAGVERTIDPGATVGVHSWGDGENDAADFPRTSSEHDAYIDYFSHMGIDPDFYWFTVDAAPFDGMHEMTRAEIAQFGLATQ